MRIKNSIVDSSAYIVYEIFNLALSFFIPKLIILNYGSDVNGLTSNINQIINLINLLQAGVVGASIFEMYLPIALGDKKNIGGIYYSSKKYFKKVSIVFFLFCLLIFPYIVFVGDSQLKIIDIFLSVLIMSISATITFKNLCSYDIIFSAHQKRYVLVGASIVDKAVYFSLVFFVIVFNLHYLYIYVSILAGNICHVLYLRKEFKKDFEKEIIGYSSYTNYKVRNQYKLFANQIIENGINALPTILVTISAGLVGASIVSIYLLVCNLFKQVFNSIRLGFSSPFGDLIASGNQDKTFKIFDVFQFFFTGLCFILWGVACVLYVPFVSLYLSDSSVGSYTSFSLAFSMFFAGVGYAQNLPLNILIDSFGLFDKMLKPNLISGIVSLFLMVALSMINYEYIYLAVGFFYISRSIFFFPLLMNTSLVLEKKNYFRFFIPIVYTAMIFFIARRSIATYILNWLDFVLSGIVLVALNIIAFCIYSILFERKQISESINIIISFKKNHTG